MSSKKAKKEKAPVERVTEQAPENLDRVRDLLFGPQLAGIDAKLASLERRLSFAIESLSKDLRGAIKSLERYARDENAQLASRLASERSSRKSAVSELERALHGNGDKMAGQLAEVEQNLVETEQRLRQGLHDEAVEIRDQLRGEVERMREMVEATHDSLDGGKMGREALAGMLRDLAAQVEQPEGDATTVNIDNVLRL